MSEYVDTSDNLNGRWRPAKWDNPDAYVLQALARGEADAAQQKRALEVIVNQLAGTYEETFVPREPDTSAYLMGRASVGRQIVKLLKVDLAAMRQIAAAKKTTTARKGNKP
jgi:hypothetical protein